jgi:hypothetical protein
MINTREMVMMLDFKSLVTKRSHFFATTSSHPRDASLTDEAC